MSKRYGRTQKRKHREKIAELEQGFLECGQRLGHYMREANECKHQFEDFLAEFKRWWDNSVLLDPKTVDHMTELPPYYRIAHHAPLSIMDYTKESVMSEMELKYQTLEAMHVACEHGLGERHMHIIVRAGKDSYAYYFDPHLFASFKGMPEKMILEMNRQIVHAFREKFHDSKRG